MTTDTTTDGEFNETGEKLKAETPTDEQTGILSSDEEERHDESEAAPTQSEGAESEAIDSFNQSADIFNDEIERDRVEHDFKFAERDLEEYAAKLETKS